ncbi:MAG: hypothetical protein IKK72_05480 [Oscillospiraceae bacterium]|nr:hypothetical protein [Oscillospiraceae bacterium]
MKNNKLACTGAALGMLALILDSRTATQAAAGGIDLCIRAVIPSLFPFFLLSGFLTGNLQSGKWMAKCFRCPESCGSLLLTSFLGGYPLGARLAAQEYHRKHITKDQADRLIMFCSQAGPSFLFGITAGQLEKPHLVWLLWIILLLSALSVAWLFPAGSDFPKGKTEAKKMTLTDAMYASIKAMASVCGWVVVFSVLMAFLKRWFLWLLPESAQVLLCGLLELTNGCLMLENVQNPLQRFLIASVMLNFGGLCVLMQTASVTEGLSLGRYILGKLLQTVFAVLYALAFMGHPYLLLVVFLLFFGRKLLNDRNNSSIPIKLGV